MNVDILNQLTPQSEVFVSGGSYYEKKIISNSILDKAWAIANNKKIKNLPLDALNFGSAFHCAVLEPQNFDIKNYQGVNEMQLHVLIEACKNSEKLQEILKYSIKEVEHYFYLFDLPCKMKADAVLVRESKIVDLKTTAATNIIDFSKTIAKYNYDRQMSFYCDALGVEKSLLVGVSKTTFELFFIELTKEELENGRKKYEKIMRIIKEQNLFDKIFLE